MNKSILGMALLFIVGTHTADSDASETLQRENRSQHGIPSEPIPVPYRTQPLSQYDHQPHAGSYPGALILSPPPEDGEFRRSRMRAYPSLPDVTTGHGAAPRATAPPSGPTGMSMSAADFEAFKQFQAEQKRATAEAQRHAKEQEALAVWQAQRSREYAAAALETAHSRISPTASLYTVHSDASGSLPPKYASASATGPYGSNPYSGLPFVDSAFKLIESLKTRVTELEVHLTEEARRLAVVKQQQTSIDQSPRVRRRGSVLGRLGKSETAQRMEALEKVQQQKDKELRAAALPIRRCMAVAAICDASLTDCMTKETGALLEQAGMTSDA